MNTIKRKLSYYAPQKEILVIFKTVYSLQLRTYQSLSNENQVKHRILQKYIVDDGCKLTVENYKSILETMVLIEDAFVVSRIGNYEVKEQEVFCGQDAENYEVS